jgi:transcriptional regulator NrdR family protein
MTVITIKREGETQEFESKKIYASVYSASLNAHYAEKKSEDLAQQIETKIIAWVKAHSHVNSHQIRDRIIEELCKINEEDVATLYKHHLDLS